MKNGKKITPGRMQKKIPAWLSFLILLFPFLFCSCQKPQSYIEGSVCTLSDLAQSYLSTKPNRNSNSKPVVGATIFLTFDGEGNEPIKGFDTISDNFGKYRIEITEIPPSKNPQGYYYLNVKREGFEPIIQRVGLGPLSPFMRNTAILKPVIE